MSMCTPTPKYSSGYGVALRPSIPKVETTQTSLGACDHCQLCKSNIQKPECSTQRLPRYKCQQRIDS
jgi:ribosomal protein L37AE/L43A